MLKPVKRSNLSSSVFQQLRDDILNEEYQPGDRLPSERELCDILKVNRSSVREALKRLEQARLIEIHHGEGSIVLDFKAHAGFDVLRHLVMPGGRINNLALHSIIEVRLLVAAEIARLAARRIQPPELERLEELAAEIEKLAPEEAETLQALDFEFHYTLARGGENLALLLLLNSIKGIYFELRDYFMDMFSENMESRSLYRKIYQAVRAHKEELAGRLMTELLESGHRILRNNYQAVRLEK